MIANNVPLSSTSPSKIKSDALTPLISNFNRADLEKLLNNAKASEQKEDYDQLFKETDFAVLQGSQSSSNPRLQ